MSNDTIFDAVKYEEAVKKLLRRGWLCRNDIWEKDGFSMDMNMALSMEGLDGVCE